MSAKLSPTPLGALLTLREAEREVGFPSARGHRLRRYVEARERKLGRHIMERAGGKGRGTRYLVTLASLRRHCPELFGRPFDELERNMRSYLREIDERMTARGLDVVSEHVEPRLNELRGITEALDEAVQDLGVRLAKLTAELESLDRRTHG